MGRWQGWGGGERRGEKWAPQFLCYTAEGLHGNSSVCAVWNREAPRGKTAAALFTQGCLASLAASSVLSLL